MSDDSQVNLTLLRSVIDSYRKRKENVEKREDEVKERLAQMRKVRHPRRDDSSIEINIATRESIVRSTSQALAPPNSYIPPTYSQQDTYGRGSSELLFHSKYCAYKDSDKSLNERDSREIINKYASMPPKKPTGKSKFSYKNNDSRSDVYLDSDSEVQNANVTTRKHKKKRANKNVHTDQREPREVARKYDKHSKRVRGSLDRVPVIDMSSSSQVDLNTEPTSDGHKYKKTKATPCKSIENKNMDYAAERLARIGLKRGLDDRTSAEHPGNEKRIDRKSVYSQYEEDERRDPTKLSKQGKSSRNTSNREIEQLSRYPALMEMLKDCPASTSVASERKTKKSYTPNQKALSRKDSLNDFESNRDRGISRRWPITSISSTSESGSTSQYEASNKTISARRVDSCHSSDEERVRSHSPRGYQRRARPHSPAERPRLPTPTNRFAGPSAERTNERGFSAGEYSREDRDERPHSEPVNRGSLASRPPIHDDSDARGLHQRGFEQKARRHSPAERLDEGRPVGDGYSRQERDDRPQSQPRGRPNPPASRPPVHDEGYRRSHQRSPAQRARPQSPAERPDDGGSVQPYHHASSVEQYRSPTRDQNQLIYNTLVANDGMPIDENDFDEQYSNNFLCFLIRKSLPRAMSEIILTTTGGSNKPSEEVLSSVQDIVTIKKLICDELDRREKMGRPFKLQRREKLRLMNTFVYAKKIHDRLERGFSVREALSISQTKSLESSIRLHERTIRAIRQANHILGGDRPDPEDADDLEKAAEDCLRNLGKLHTETVTNYRVIGSTSKEPRPSPHNKLPGQPLTQDTCKSCREDLLANEVNRLKDAILNIEQHMNAHNAEKAIISRKLNEMNKLGFNLHDEHGHNCPAAHSYFQQKCGMTNAGTFNMPTAMSLNPINNAYPVHKMGHSSFSNACPRHLSCHKTAHVHRQS